MFNLYPKANVGDFIKDMGRQKRSLGLVQHIDDRTKMMLVNFPKINRTQWVMWNNYGQYKVV